MKRFIFTLSVFVLFFVGCSDPSNSSVPATVSEFSVWSSPYNEVAIIDDTTFYFLSTYDYVASKSLSPALPSTGNSTQYRDWVKEFLATNPKMVTRGKFITYSLQVGTRTGTVIDLTAEHHNTVSPQRDSAEHKSPCKVPIFMYGTETQRYFIQWYSSPDACGNIDSPLSNDEVAEGISFEYATPFDRVH